MALSGDILAKKQIIQFHRGGWSCKRHRGIGEPPRPLEKDALRQIHQGRPEAMTECRSRGKLCMHLGSISYTWTPSAGRDLASLGICDRVSFRAELL